MPWAPIAERFWDKVQRADGCWTWTGAREGSRMNYGILKIGGRRAWAHRVAFELTKGPIPPGLIIRHKCDNPICVNPDHLELGTTADNMRDKVERGRAHRMPGESHPFARLTDAQVREIRALQGSGCTQRELAARFGVGESTISLIVNRHRWKHLA